MLRATAGIVIILFGFAWSAASAQSTPDERRWSGHVAAGGSLTTGRTNDYLENGWILSGGVTFRPRLDGPFSLRLDGHYSEYDATNALIDLGSALTQTRIDDGEGSTAGADLNAVYDIPFGSRATGYVTAGVGIDRRRVEFTQVTLFNGVFCDPWWGVCGVGTVAGDRLVAHDTQTDFAWNGGVGVRFNLGRQELFVEASYHRIETRRPTEYIPLEIGLRF
jgi:opacity protein-like surface antigen